MERNLPITASLVGAVQKADPLAVYRSARALYQTDCREAFLRLALPKVYVTSEKAATYPVDPAPLAAQGVPCLQVPIAGRAPMLENPDGYAETLARALQ